MSMKSGVPVEPAVVRRRFARTMLLLGAGALTSLSACREPTTSPGDTHGSVGREISSGTIGVSPRQFFFLLRDLGPADFQGTFDASLAPEVTVCLWVDGACQSTAVGPVTLGSGDAASLTVDAKRERYLFRWRTRHASLEPDAVYRLLVRVGGMQLGYLDIATGRKQRDLRDVDRREFLPLRVGGTVTVPFRIEDGPAIPEGIPGRYESDPDICVDGCLLHASPWNYISLVWGGVELGDLGSYGEATVGFLGEYDDPDPDIPPVPAPGSVAIAPTGSWSWRYDEEGAVEIWVDGEEWGHWGGSAESGFLAPLYPPMVVLHSGLTRISD